MNNKQLEEIITAILTRQYSWACVLMLRFHGYDPLHYIPYRTYIRLLKKNYQLDQEQQSDTDSRKIDFLPLKSSKVGFIEKKVDSDKYKSAPIPVGQCRATG
jgi:hypothetical protein